MESVDNEELQSANRPDNHAWQPCVAISVAFSQTIYTEQPLLSGLFACRLEPIDCYLHGSIVPK